MFHHLKTSTKISLKFTLFSAGILALIGIMINLAFFSFRYRGLNTHPQSQKHWPQSTARFIPHKNFQSHHLTLPLHSEAAQELISLQNVLHIAQVQEYYLYLNSEGNTLHIRNITEHIELQYLLLRISITIITGGSLLSYLISLFFVKTALKKLNTLNHALEHLDIDNLQNKIPLKGHPEDEINKVIKKFNQAQEKIHLQTLGLKDFIKNASHELKTPLMTMSSLISLARKSQDYTTLADRLKQEIATIDQLLETLLLITQIEEKIHLKKEPIDLTHSIKKCIEDCSPHYADKMLTLQLQLPPKLMKEVNPQGRNSIITNLIHNAFKFSNQKGEILIELTSTRFHVRNTGPGLPPSQEHKIRERFWQADTAHTDRKSFGLGLYLAQLFARKQGFILTCENQPGKGVSFILTL